ncbi:hypothetical protein ANCDUO_12562 [Ancylostoma duodenale]|uniref:Uncharacterized protein n=1 Tax=Ancylostoma duodenale TaxID=51022 RepID=A0A0C2GE89_9BILA|nr:hypothetical protein ANCDUO_12562 [Ancylostoma duodenale]
MAETGQVPAAFILRLPHDHDMIEMETANLFSLVEVQGNSQGEEYWAVKGLVNDASRRNVGTRGSSAWRAALTMSTLTIPSFAFWCLLMRGPSAMAYQLGFSLAIVVVFCSVAGILHYVPSPSLFAYPQLRFQSSTLRLVLSILQTAVTFICILLVLLHSSSLLASVSLFSLYLCVALVAFFPLFAVVFSGYSCIMTLSLILNILAYFPIPTLHKLRLTLAFHGVFQLFSSILVFLTVSLFYAFLEKKCSLSFSYQTLFQFAKSSRCEVLTYGWKEVTVKQLLQKFEKWLFEQNAVSSTIRQLLRNKQNRDMCPRREISLVEAMVVYFL